MTIKSDGAPVLTTQDRISIAQCLNLAVESIGVMDGVNKGKIIERAKLFHEIKTELETEYAMNGNAFETKQEKTLKEVLKNEGEKGVRTNG